MFFAMYKTTLKNLLRSKLLWIALLLVLVVAMNHAIEGYTGYVEVDENGNFGKELIFDTDPRYVVQTMVYIQTILNLFKVWVMQFAMPLFAVLSVMIIQSRDYGDNFYEIEKSRGVKTSEYFLGRLAAILTVNIPVAFGVGFIAYNYYILSRGGYPELTLGEYFADSTVRLLRVFVCAVIPGLLTFIAFTYFIGSLLKSGFVGALAGISYVLVHCLFGAGLRFDLPEIFKNFMIPTNLPLYQHWTFWDTGNLLEGNFAPATTTPQVLLCIGYLVGISVLMFTVSYIFQRKRTL